MINGIDYIFIIPPLVILVIALLLITSKVLRGSYKAAFVGSSRILIFGGLFLLVLFVLWSAIYFAGGGH